jgi:DNA-binding transcriptional LysR family regulator
MELGQLRSFLCVAESGNVSRAAEQVHLTQPAVTKQIHALERELGTTLLDRTGRGVELTAAGIVLRDYAHRSLALLEEGRQVIADIETGAVGQLLIGAGTTTSIFRLPAWLQALKGALPGIAVVVHTGDSREVVNWTLSREVELGLVTTPVQNSQLKVVELFSEEIVLVAPPLHISEVTAFPQSSPRNPIPFPLILFPQSSGFREYLDRVLAAAGMEIHVKMETDSVEAIKSFVATGLGASFLPAGAVATEIADGTLQQVTVKSLPKLQRQTSVIWRADRHLGAAAKAFLQILQH